MSSPTTTATLIPNVDPNSRAWCLFIAAQSFNVTSIDGTPTTLSLQIVDNHYHQLISSATIVGFTLGFGVMLHIVLGINAVTDAKYRRQHIFLLNLASLFLISIRSILDSKIVNSSYNNIGPTFLNTWGQYPPSTWSPIVMSAAINPLIYATISSSLILQVRAAFAAEPITKRCLTCVGIPAAIGLCGFAVALAYYAIRVQFSPDVITPAWLYTSTRVYFMVFITACCFAFLYKLFGTIYRRRGMGFPANEFGPLQILLVGFLECLVVPSNTLTLIRNLWLTLW